MRAKPKKRVRLKSESKTTNLARADTTFAHLAKVVSAWMGAPWAFGVAAAMIVIWLISGPFFKFSDTWQLIINTSTTIITFLMVFLIQNTQNREGQAVQLKLDELIRSIKGAHTALIDLEELTDHELSLMKQKYLEIAAEGRECVRKGIKDTGSPPMDTIA